LSTEVHSTVGAKNLHSILTPC